MSHGCRLVSDGCAVDARWQRDGDVVLVSPASGPVQAVALGEIAGISGDGFAITLHAEAGDIVLERLGADGPTLLQELRRDWLPIRAGILRLSGGEAPGKTYVGTVRSQEYSGPFRGFLADDRLICAPEGRDLLTFFLADCKMVAFVEQEYLIRGTGWEGEETVFSKLAGETAAFVATLQGAREKLARLSAAVVSRHLPTLAPVARAKLGAQWLPGRVLSFSELESMAPGFEAAFLASWLPHCPRADTGRKLMEGVAASDRYLGFAVAGSGEDSLLWLLVRREGTWSLELLSQGDYATYLFAGGAELPKLISGLVRLPEFSREALYLPLAELTDERAKYAIPARELPALRELRARFSGRRIHAPAQ